jgi:hypothetical protein
MLGPAASPIGRAALPKCATSSESEERPFGREPQQDLPDGLELACVDEAVLRDHVDIAEMPLEGFFLADLGRISEVPTMAWMRSTASADARRGETFDLRMLLGHSENPA